MVFTGALRENGYILSPVDKAAVCQLNGGGEQGCEELDPLDGTRRWEGSGEERGGFVCWWRAGGGSVSSIMMIQAWCTAAALKDFRNGAWYFHIFGDEEAACEALVGLFHLGYAVSVWWYPVASVLSDGPVRQQKEETNVH